MSIYYLGGKNGKNKNFYTNVYNKIKLTTGRLNNVYGKIVTLY